MASSRTCEDCSHRIDPEHIIAPPWAPRSVGRVYCEKDRPEFPDMGWDCPEWEDK